MQSAIRSVRACARVASQVAQARAFSVTAAFPYNGSDGDVAEFPRKMKGLDYDLNFSLANDDLTTRGEAYRNAPVKDLIEFAPRSTVKVTKERAVISSARGAKAVAYATDALPGFQVMDIEEFEGRVQSVRDDCLSYAPRLFVEDGAIGSSRTSELRVRVISDSSVTALAFRSLLNRIPLYNPEIFPRTVTVYAASLASSAIAAGKDASGAAAKPYTVVDVDPATSKAVVIAVGDVSIASLRQAVATAAGRLMQLGGYRHVKGGDQNPNLRKVREDGVLEWYIKRGDAHWYPPASDAHPDLLALPADVVVGKDNSISLVLGGSSALSGAAAKAGRLYAAHDAVWTPEGVTAFWGGTSLPTASAPAPLPRGALQAEDSAYVPLAGPKAVPAPAQVIVIGGTGEDAASKALSVAGLDDKRAEKLKARLAAGVKVVAVATEAEAIKALGL